MSARSPRTTTGTDRALQWARQLDADVVWALEDCRHVSHHLERALVTSGERVIRVPPKLMGVSRRGKREAGKSDQIDARSVARAVLREGITGSQARSWTRPR